MDDFTVITAEARLRRELPSPALRRQTRERADLSQQEVASLLSVHPSSVSRWESGSRSPARSVAGRYSELLARLTREVGS